jgi:2-phospho-L-lactate transferase/gluconeogenesis factor (CofD/UPF0052 family)
MEQEHDGHESDEGEYRALSRLMGKRVVTIGGGTGPFAVLNSLNRYPCSISAIVSMADSGGSSRRLMDEFGVLPLGDLRQALVALSRNGRLWRDVFNFRFPQGAFATEKPGEKLNGAENGKAGGPATALEPAPRVGGHNLGNLIISALQGINEGNLLHAIEDAEALLDTQAAAVALSRVTLRRVGDGDEIWAGRTLIRALPHQRAARPIRRVYLRATSFLASRRFAPLSAPM